MTYNLWKREQALGSLVSFLQLLVVLLDLCCCGSFRSNLVKFHSGLVAVCLLMQSEFWEDFLFYQWSVCNYLRNPKQLYFLLWQCRGRVFVVKSRCWFWNSFRISELYFNYIFDFTSLDSGNSLSEPEVFPSVVFFFTFWYSSSLVIAPVLISRCWRMRGIGSWSVSVMTDSLPLSSF